MILVSFFVYTPAEHFMSHGTSADVTLGCDVDIDGEVAARPLFVVQRDHRVGIHGVPGGNVARNGSNERDNYSH